MSQQIGESFIITLSSLDISVENVKFFFFSSFLVFLVSCFVIFLLIIYHIIGKEAAICRHHGVFIRFGRH